MQLPLAVAEEMLAHARRELPNEACGLVAGRLADGRARAYHPARNAAASPFRFDLDSEDLVRITFTIEEAGDDLLAIFHSHVRSAAVPSPTDQREAMYPQQFFLIASLVDRGASPEGALRAWRLQDGGMDEVELTLV